MKKEINIFYSWQSDLDRETNQKAIRIVLKKVATNLEENFDEFVVTVDEATREVEGSPEIPTTILNKINNCDIFVCDLTTVNNDTNDKRKMPNPNVTFELGYAVSILGWDRIIMLFNKNYGDFETELPFDLEKRRIVSFKVSDKEDSSGKGGLRTDLKNNIELIIKNDPEKKSNLNDKKVDIRKKDVENLSNLLATIHINTFDIYLHYLPNRIIDKIYFFFEGFQEIFYSGSFHIYEKELYEKLSDFFVLWNNTLGHSNLYKSNGNGNFILNLQYDVFERKQDQEDLSILVNEVIQLKESFKDLIKFVRHNYLEVDVDELSKIALENYNEYHKDKK